LKNNALVNQLVCFNLFLMSNQIDHRQSVNEKNRRHNERPVPAMGCGGEGHNGQLGRKDWKLMSRRNERRNLKQGREASIQKRIKKVVLVAGWRHRKDQSPRPVNPDTGLDHEKGGHM
jgi:hypothetical protein